MKDDQGNLYVHIYEHRWGHWFRTSASITLYVILVICNHRIGGGSIFIDIVLFVLLFLAALFVISTNQSQFKGSRYGAISWLQDKHDGSKYSDQDSEIQEESGPR